MSITTEVAVFGGGCFWCTEAVFTRLKGVIRVTPGYAGGSIPHPTYEQVSTGATGHAEVAQIEFDPSIISYDDLLEVFWATHDPTTLNQQGNDIGTQYRSVIFYTNETQKITAEKSIAELEKSKKFARPIVTKLQPLQEFYEAEDYHKTYYEHHKDQPYCRFVITPKLAKITQRLKK